MLLGPEWTDHAERRKIFHSITEKEIADTWLFGEAYRKENENSWRLVGSEITLVLNNDGDIIITMYRNNLADRNFAKSAVVNRNEGTIRGVAFIRGGTI